MKLLDIQQNTPEWEELRRSHIGASDCPIIVRKSPYKKPFQLWEEKVLGKKGFVSAQMRRGQDLEQSARDWYSGVYGPIFPAVVQSSKHKWMIASLDGLSEDKKTIVEIKCPGEKVYEEISKGNIPEYYHWQMQHQMVVCGRDSCTLVVYNGADVPILFRIEADLVMQDELLREEDKFYQSMLEFVAPEAQESDIVEREDKDWLDCMKELKKAQETRKLAEEYEAICKDAAKFLMGGDIAARGGGMEIRRYSIEGRVDYTKIPELKNVDLGKFRKPPSEGWKFRSL